MKGMGGRRPHSAPGGGPCSTERRSRHEQCYRRVSPASIDFAELVPAGVVCTVPVFVCPVRPLAIMSSSDRPSIDVFAEIDALRAFYDASRDRIDTDDALYDAVPSVSSWSPAQHLYHIWRANASMLKAARLLALEAVDAESPSLSDVGASMLRSGRIPRGVADAPDAMKPPADLDRDALTSTWDRSYAKLNAVADDADALDAATGGLSHPAWGTLTASQWVRAARVHSDHHFGILHEIDATRGGR